MGERNGSNRLSVDCLYNRRSGRPLCRSDWLSEFGGEKRGFGENVMILRGENLGGGVTPRACGFGNGIMGTGIVGCKMIGEEAFHALVG